jgi:phosphatidylglycerol:prolipoprotein diacylglycerol transferase
MIHHGGLVFYGGLLGASLVTVWFARARGVPLWRLADTLAPSIALGQAVGRVGCLVNGCCYGLPTALPWGLHYPADHATCGVAVHPVQAYEALLDLGLYAALEWRHRHKRFDGQVFALYLIAYALLRGGVEFLRGDYEEKHLGGWATPAQLVGAILLPAGIWLWRRQSGRLRSG